MGIRILNSYGKIIINTWGNHILLFNEIFNSDIANDKLLLNETILRVLVIMKLKSSPSSNKTYLEYGHFVIVF